MKPIIFFTAFEAMRQENLGKQLERREIEMLARRYGIYINSTLWVCGIDKLFTKGRIGPKFVYNFRNSPVTLDKIEAIFNNVHAYKHDTQRTIEHAKAILMRYGIRNVF